MKISKRGATMQQIAYARRAWGGRADSKKQIALDVGYSPSVADSPKSKIEDHKGFNNAMAVLAAESNNLALSIMHEFKSRGVQDFSNKDLVGALNAIGGAWTRFNNGLREENHPVDNGKNRLKTIVLQRIENQTLNTGSIREVEKIEDNNKNENENENENEEMTQEELDDLLDF
jgi:hypothetical protein